MHYALPLNQVFVSYLVYPGDSFQATPVPVHRMSALRFEPTLSGYRSRSSFPFSLFDGNSQLGLANCHLLCLRKSIGKMVAFIFLLWLGMYWRISPAQKIISSQSGNSKGSCNQVFSFHMISISLYETIAVPRSSIAEMPAL